MRLSFCIMQGVIILSLLGQFFDPVGAFGYEKSYGAACADVDRNGSYDVVVASDSGIVYYRNIGTGSFEAPKKLATQVVARTVLGGDLDGDGDIDFFVGTDTEDFLLLNSGDDINFEELSGYFDADTSRAAALVDFDLDGDLDIFVAGDTSKLYINDGGSFFAVGKFPKGYAVSFADYNNDGFADFALSGADSVYFYHNAGAGLFTRDAAVQVSTPGGLCWFDREPDKNLDLAVASLTSVNSLIQPSAGFSRTNIGVESEPSMAIAAGDFDGQPGVDLLVVNYGDESRIYHGPLLETSADDTVSYGTMYAVSVATADLDKERGMDAVVVGAGGNALFRNTVSRQNRVFVNVKGRADKVAGLSNTIGAGARLELCDKGIIKEFWEIAAGSGQSGQDAPQRCFPISDPDSVLLLVRWPRSGVLDSIPFQSLNLPAVINAYEDITPPLPPQSLTLYPPHDTLNWSNVDSVKFSWKEAQDPLGSGVKGYSALWSLDTSDVPDGIISAFDTIGYFKAGCEGRYCYFLLSSVDSVGNISHPARYSPLKLDFTKPLGITQISPSSGAYINDTFVSYTWKRGLDATSRIRNYHVETSDRSNYLVVLDSATLPAPAGTDTLVFHQSLNKLPESKESWYYWRVITADSAGNSDTIPNDSFKIDITQPHVTSVYPPDGKDSVSLRPTILITFSEPMFAADSSDKKSATNTSHYVVRTFDPLKEYKFYVEQINPSVFKLNLLEKLPGSSLTMVEVNPTVSDRAGNKLVSTYSWNFTTGEDDDMLGPLIDYARFNPSPTKGEKKIQVSVRTSDSLQGGSPILGCSYWIDDDTTTHTMKSDDFKYKLTVVCYDTLSLDSFPLALGQHQFKFQSFDGSGNKSGFFYSTLEVTSSPPPLIEIEILNDDTLRIKVGDTLNLRIVTTQPLKDLWISLLCSDSVYHLQRYFAPGPVEYMLFNAPLEGFPAGQVKIEAQGRSEEDTLVYGQGTRFFNLNSIPLLTDERTFAAPNPASGQMGIYFIPGEDVRASLRVFTIDGQLVWSPIDIENAIRGSRSVFLTDVSQWPVGIYFYVIKVSHVDGRSSAVRKAFAVVR